MVKNVVVAKFGGSSLANAVQIRKVESILNSDDKRRYVVVSAPGTDKDNSYKVTDILYNLYYNSRKNVSTKKIVSDYKKLPLSQEELVKIISERYSTIALNLGMKTTLPRLFDTELENLLKKKNTQVDEVVSRGENFHARLIAEYLHAKFVDAADLIYIDEENDPDNDKTMRLVNQLTKLKGKRIVIPGFYGNTDKKIRTFSRGGSDFTGSIIAAGVNASLYENWTDQNGILCVDPRLFDETEAKSIPVIDVMTFKECRELTYSGFSVLNDETVGPVRKRNIPINIRNTNNPSYKGTLITAKHNRDSIIVGIAGKDGFCTIDIEKYMMNKKPGFGKGILDIIAKRKINYEHMPSGIDDISIIIDEKVLEPYKKEILEEIESKFHPDNLKVTPDLALISIVGEGMFYKVGISEKVTGCLARNNINIEIMNQGASESNIIIGVASKDYKKGIRVLYEELLKKK